MDIAVVVPKQEYWEAFLRDLRDLWQYERLDARSIRIGKITFRKVSLSEDIQKVYGLRADKVYAYNCWDSRIIGELSIRLHTTEIVSIRN